MNEVFVDAGAWIGLALPRDIYHERAAHAYRGLQQSHHLVTTNLVVSEAYATIRRRGGHVVAMRFLRSLRATSRLTWLYSNAPLEAQAEAILARYADQDFSFVDAVSFAVMHQRGIAEAFAFDRHFLVAGFSLVPTPP